MPLLRSIVLLALLTLPPIHRPSVPKVLASAAIVDPSEEDYFWDVQQYTTLYNHIVAQKWDRALRQLHSDPDEASVLVVKRSGSGGRHGQITERVLPMHKAFEVDIVDDARVYDLPPPAGGNVPNMTEDQIELLSELIRIHPDAMKMTDHMGRLPLHVAMYSSVSPPASIVRRMIAANVDGTNRTDSDQRLPIHAACVAPIVTSELISELITANPHSVTVQSDKDGGLPIHYASWGGGRRPDDVATVMRLLVEAYPDGLRVADRDGDVPLGIMVKYGRTSIEAFRYVLGVDTEALDEVVIGGSSQTSHASDSGSNTTVPSSGDTLLHSAVTMSPHSMTEDMIRAILDVRPTLAKIANGRGQLPLHSALDHYGATESIVTMLLEAYPEAVKEKDEMGERLPLHYACKEGVAHAGVVELLIEAYPDGLLVSDASNALPLHLALKASPRGGVSTKAKGVKSPRVVDQVAHTVLTTRPDLASVTDPDSTLLPLHIAITKIKPPFLVKEILNAYPDAAKELVGEGDKKVSALHVLATVRDQYLPEEVNEIASALLDVKPECAKLKDGMGRLPLHAASDEAEKVRKRTERTKKKSKKTSITSSDVLLQTLLQAYPEAVQERDNGGKLPLHYSVAALDAATTIKLLDSYQDAAKSQDQLPLHIACGSLRSPYEQYEGDPEAVDVIIRRLLDIYPEAASIGDKDGSLPLAILSRMPNIMQYVREETFQALVDANPNAAQAKYGDGPYPIHEVIHNLHYGDNPTLALPFTRSLLGAYPKAVEEEDGRSNLPLHHALAHAQGAEKQAESSKVLGDIARLLYNEYPKAVSFADRSEHYPLHHIARIMGQTAGSSKRAPFWAPLFMDIMNQDESILEKLDTKGRSPLHVLCFHLGDAAVDNEDGATYERSPEFDDVIRTIVLRSAPVLRLEDVDGQTPFYMLNRELGRGSDKLAGTLRFVKDEINMAKRKAPEKSPTAKESGDRVDIEKKEEL